MLLRNEAYLIRKSLKGNQRAQKELFDQNINCVYNSVFRIVKRRDLAEDLVQESFITAFERLDELRNGNFGAWVRRIAVNKSLNTIRSNNHLLVHDVALLEIPEDDFELPEEIDPKQIMQAIEHLPEGAQLVFKLFAFEEMKHQEIAERLDISVSTSKSQLNRARKLLKEALCVYDEV